MSTAAKKKAAAKRAANETNAVADPPPVGITPDASALVPSAVAPANNSEIERTLNRIAEIPGIAPQFIAVAGPEEVFPEIVNPPPRVTPGRIVQVTVEAYLSHIVTRPAIVVSTSQLDSLINVHVFWDHFRDGAYLSPWRPHLPYCESEQPGSWRFPTRS
jgi:hypothetical protein